MKHVPMEYSMGIINEIVHMKTKPFVHWVKIRINKGHAYGQFHKMLTTYSHSENLMVSLIKHIVCINQNLL